MDIKSLIEQAQASILQQLVELAPKDRRNEAMRLVEQFRQGAVALSTIASTGGEVNHAAPAGDARYAACQYVIDAIKLYLSDLGRPAKREQIIEGVIAAGFRPGREGITRGNIKKSITMYVEGQAKSKAELKQVGDLIGLAAWEDNRFQLPQ